MFATRRSQEYFHRQPEQASCSTCGLRLWAQALCRTVQVRIRVNEYTPAHANKVARFARFYKLDSTLRISAASRQTKTSERCNCQPKKRDGCRESALAVFFGQKNEHSLRRALPKGRCRTVITIIATQTGYTTRFVRGRRGAPPLRLRRHCTSLSAAVASS